MKLLALLAVLSLIACSPAQTPASTAQTQAEAPKEVPITSKSPDAVAHFKKGRDLADNLRQAETTGEYDQALKLDPDFALALAYRGMATPGAQGVSDLEQAKAKASNTTKEEQLLIDALVTGRRGENAESE